MTPLLFAGPLYVSFLEQTLPFQAHWTGLEPVRDWQGIRNYLAVRVGLHTRSPRASEPFQQGPITEELNFRSCVTAVLLLGGWSGGRLVFLAPLSFGVGACAARGAVPCTFVNVSQRIYTTGGTRTIVMGGTRPR